MALEFETVAYAVREGVGHVRMNQPETGNRLDAQLREELLQALLTASEDENVRVVVLSGEGESFCAGIDPREREEMAGKGAGFERARSLQDEGRRLVGLLRELGKPVVAFVDGEASGAGAALALACDVRIVTGDASFDFDFMQPGGFPDWGTTYFLPQLVGSGRALDLLWSGRRVTAHEAQAMNLTQVLIEGSDANAVVRDYATRLASLPPTTARLTAMAVHASSSYDFASMLDFESEASQQCWPSSKART